VVDDVKDDGSIEIELEEDESDSEQEALLAKESEEKPSDEDSKNKELDVQSENVKKRIDKLTYKIREAERREQAALEFARGLKNELDNSRQRSAILDKSLVQEFDTRLKTQDKHIRDRLRSAIDSSDIDAQIEAQAELAALAVENEKLRQSKVQRETRPVEDEDYSYVPPSQAAPSRPDPKAEEWGNRNKWFGENRAMTNTAMEIHGDLITEGYDPANDDYFSELDTRIRMEFPHKFQSTERAAEKPSSAVASARPSTRSGNTKSVKLTPSQIKIAKSLGVSLDVYAKYASKSMQG